MNFRESVEELTALKIEDAVRKARWRYVRPPLAVLPALVLTAAAVFALTNFSIFFIVMPDILFISAVFVIFFGAFYDFGASSYLKEVTEIYRQQVTEEDMRYINRQQLILTLLYLLIGALYVAAGALIYLLSLYLKI